jgi:hypothetical protein
MLRIVYDEFDMGVWERFALLIFALSLDEAEMLVGLYPSLGDHLRCLTILNQEGISDYYLVTSHVFVL